MIRGRALMVAALCFIAATAAAQSEQEGRAIAAKIERLDGRDFKCSRVRKLFRKLRPAHPAYHFAFAGRRGATITGIYACEHAWGTSETVAMKRAMTACRRQEARLGTGPNGKHTCRFLE
ncbi:MAG: hypothetical protein AAFU86_10220 [Pseudomonadota bacterium]